MKRVMILYLVFILIVACQPTPETEYVVSRKDYTTYSGEASVPEPGGQSAKTWIETVQPEKGCLKEIRVEVTFPEFPAGQVSVIRATPVSFDAETIRRISEYFVPNALLSLKTVTKQDLVQEIRELLAELDGADTLEFESDEAKAHYKAELLQEIEDLKALYADADDGEAERISYESLCDHDKADFLLLDASEATEAQCRLTCGVERGDPRASMLSVTITDCELATEAMTETDTIRKCSDMLIEMGIEGYAFNHAEALAEKKIYFFTRQINGIPYSRAIEMTALPLGDDEVTELSPELYWLDESIRFTVFENKLLGFSWLSKTEYGAPVRTDVPLMSVEQAKQRIINGLTFYYSIAVTKGELSHRIVISDIQFGYKRIPAASGVREYVLVPAWTVSGTVIPKYASSADAPDLILNAENECIDKEDAILLVINAIDGNIIV